MKKTKILLAIFVFFLTLLPRLYKLNSPLADWHSFRQADTAAVSRNFIKDGFNPLFPQSDSFTILNETQTPNPNRYFINEFPLYNTIVAVIYHYKGIDTMYGRFVSAIAASVGAVFLFFLVNNLFGKKIALVTSLYYAVNPYNVYYGRVFMPDPSFVSFSIIAVYFFHQVLSNPSISKKTLFVVTFALAMLVKPYAIFLYPLFVFWQFKDKGPKGLFNLSFIGTLALAMIPLALWRYHISLHPEGAFASKWLLNGDHIRFTGAFFRWLIYDRLNRLIFATGGFVLLVFGLTRSLKSSQGQIVFAWFSCILLYMTVFAKGNVTHDYYQLPIMPVGSILVALGISQILEIANKWWQKIIYLFLAGSLIVISIAFGWYEVRGFYNINNPAIIEAGKRVDLLTPASALVIAPYQTDPAFLYQTNRHGWTTGGDIDSKIKAGATHYVTTSYDDEARLLEQKYKVVEKNPLYLIIDLTSPK